MTGPSYVPNMQHSRRAGLFPRPPKHGNAISASDGLSRKYLSMSTCSNVWNTNVVATGGDASDVFDPAEALDRTCDDLELLAELAELFTENRDRLLVELTEAVAAGNAQGVSEAAHALKGSVGTFSTKRPYLIARELEFCGRDARLEAAPQLLAGLKVALAELEVAVSAFLSASR